MALSTASLFKRLGANENWTEFSDSDKNAVQQVLMGILSDISEICEDRGIGWCVCGGCCLGSVRHGGFIPWDDDLDIFILRDDFPEFVRAIESGWAGKYEVQAPGMLAGYEMGYSRLVLRGTTFRGRDDFSDSCGVFCDIFILENAPNNFGLRAIHGSVSLFLGLAWSCARFAEHADRYRAVVKGTPEAERSVNQKIAVGRLFRFRSPEDWTVAWDRWNMRCRDGDSTFVTCPAGRKHYFGELYRREDIFPASYGEFEGMRVPLPANPDAYLAALYGPGYMTPPPEAGRERHVVLEFDLGEYDPRRKGKGEAE